MKILFLPSNTASHPIETKKGLKALNHDVRIMVIATERDLNNKDIDYLLKSVYYFKKKNPLFVIHYIKDIFTMLRCFLWADILHYYYSTMLLPYRFDLKVIKLLRKKAIVEWAGSDIRNPIVDFKDNPYYSAVYDNGYEYRKDESAEISRSTQEAFANAGFHFLVSSGMVQYVDKEYLNTVHRSNVRIDVRLYQPLYSSFNNGRIRIIHTPSALIAKGTAHVVDAVEKLSKKYPVDLELISGKPRKVVLEAVQNSDIYIDQFILGYYGMAAIEAMAFGKPVFGYLKESCDVDFGKGIIPVINANPDNLTEVLEYYLNNTDKLAEAGIKSRQFVEQYHDTYKLAAPLVEIYNSI